MRATAKINPTAAQRHNQPNQGDTDMKGHNEDNLVAEYNVEHDESGVGHCWRSAGELPANIAEEVTCWIIEDQPEPGDEYHATNGQTYRLPMQRCPNLGA